MIDQFRITYQMFGLNQLRGSLAGLKLQVRNRISRKALEYAATPVLKTAKQLARPRPKRRNSKLEEILKKSGTTAFGKTGSIKRALVRKTEMKGENPIVKVGVQKKAFWANFVHAGTVPHEIKIKKGPFSGRTIRHPGSKANPFLDRAMEICKLEVLTRLRTHIKQALAQYAAKQKAKAKKR